MKQASHTKQSSTSSLRILPDVGVVDLSDAELPARLAGRVSEQLEHFAGRMREGLLAASVAIGLDVMGELMEADVTEKVGPKGKHDPDRSANRHGSEDGKVVLGGRQVPVRRPRVRSVADDNGEEHEVSLESYETFASVDLLTEHMVASMLAGLSGRRYESALEPVGEMVEAEASGTSQSSVSRRFVAATAERLAEFRSRPLGDQRWLICFIDGFDFAGHTMVGALGVTADGTKVPLGVVEGSTENKAVCTRLVSGLEDRGLDASEGVLFVLDGGKAAARAVRDVFGERAVIASRLRACDAEARGVPAFEPGEAARGVDRARVGLREVDEEVALWRLGPRVRRLVAGELAARDRGGTGCVGGLVRVGEQGCRDCPQAAQPEDERDGDPVAGPGAGSECVEPRRDRHRRFAGRQTERSAGGLALLLEELLEGIGLEQREAQVEEEVEDLGPRDEIAATEALQRFVDLGGQPVPLVHPVPPVIDRRPSPCNLVAAGFMPLSDMLRT